MAEAVSTGRVAVTGLGESLGTMGMVAAANPVMKGASKGVSWVVDSIMGKAEGTVVGKVLETAGSKAVEAGGKALASAPGRVIAGPVGLAMLGVDIVGNCGVDALKAWDPLGIYEANAQRAVDENHGVNVVSAGLDMVSDGLDGLANLGADAMDALGSASHGIADALEGVPILGPLSGGASVLGDGIGCVFGTVGTGAKDLFVQPVVEGAQNISNYLGTITVGAREVERNSKEREMAEAAEAGAETGEAGIVVPQSLYDAFDSREIGEEDLVLLSCMAEDGYIDSSTLMELDGAVSAGEVTWQGVIDALGESYGEALEGAGVSLSERYAAFMGEMYGNARFVQDWDVADDMVMQAYEQSELSDEGVMALSELASGGYVDAATVQAIGDVVAKGQYSWDDVVGGLYGMASELDDVLADAKGDDAGKAYAAQAVSMAFVEMIGEEDYNGDGRVGDVEDALDDAFADEKGDDGGLSL